MSAHGVGPYPRAMFGFRQLVVRQVPVFLQLTTALSQSPVQLRSKLLHLRLALGAVARSRANLAYA